MTSVGFGGQIKETGTEDKDQKVCLIKLNLYFGELVRVAEGQDTPAIPTAASSAHTANMT